MIQKDNTEHAKMSNWSPNCVSVVSTTNPCLRSLLIKTIRWEYSLHSMAFNYSSSILKIIGIKIYVQTWSNGKSYRLLVSCSRSTIWDLTCQRPTWQRWILYTSFLTVSLRQTYERSYRITVLYLVYFFITSVLAFMPVEKCRLSKRMTS